MERMVRSSSLDTNCIKPLEAVGRHLLVRSLLPLLLRRCLGEVSSGSLPRARGVCSPTPDTNSCNETMVLLTARRSSEGFLRLFERPSAAPRGDIETRPEPAIFDLASSLSCYVSRVIVI
ncbi:hypothetical protein Zmor_025700 [Zophobas morio]|uniref:Uncharacterized protein n=1 Tax=Zophobas morio TaxID=2755281 RepID=A0AA38HSA1_9CUCU|nr:hypothetical protein Zmor_025700 [Zophobas morio]